MAATERTGSVDAPGDSPDGSDEGTLRLRIELFDHRPDDGGSPSSNLMSRHFGSLMTAASVLFAAFLGVYSGVFEIDNSGPEVTVDVTLGGHLVASADSGDAAVASHRDPAAPFANRMAFVPVNETLDLYASRLVDVDGLRQNLTIGWFAIRPGESVERSLCPRPNESTAAVIHCPFTPTSEGVHLVRLEASDDHCGQVRWLLDRGGCNRSASATLLLQALPYELPTIVLSGDDEQTDPKGRMNLDARLSRVFGNATPEFLWTIDDVVAGTGSTLALTVPPGGPGVEGRLTVRDHFGRESRRGLTLRIDDPARGASGDDELLVMGGATLASIEVREQARTTAERERPACLTTGAPCPALTHDSGICDGGERVTLTEALSVSGVDERCTLPRRIDTAGHALEITAAEIVGTEAVFVTAQGARLLTGSMPGRGIDGAPGQGYGQPGRPGTPGPSGLPGVNAPASGSVAIATRRLDLRSLRIDTSGPRAGPGGTAGTGGRGGDGHVGNPARGSWIGCQAGPGRGGDGGPGGPGGDGGSGGNGGDGGTVRLALQAVVPPLDLRVVTYGGDGGKGGGGGAGGAGGAGGPEGSLANGCGSAGRAGRAGAPGPGGASGVDGTAGRTATIQLSLGGPVRLYHGELQRTFVDAD